MGVPGDPHACILVVRVLVLGPALFLGVADSQMLKAATNPLVYLQSWRKKMMRISTLHDLREVKSEIADGDRFKLSHP